MKKTSLYLTLISLALLLQYGCKSGGKSTSLTLVDTGYNVNISPIPPADLDTGANPKKLAEFAWEEFLALNWKSSYNKDQKRDSPDTTWNYQKGARRLSRPGCLGKRLHTAPS